MHNNNSQEVEEVTWTDFKAQPVALCEPKGHEYVSHVDGTVTCAKCPWGTRLPGYMRVLDGKIVDLRVARAN